MCDICNSTPCLDGCPNKPEPNSIGECIECCKPIYIGENYAIIQGELFHEECLEEFSVDDWLDMLGSSVKEAEPYEPDYYE